MTLSLIDFCPADMQIMCVLRKMKAYIFKLTYGLLDISIDIIDR